MIFIKHNFDAMRSYLVHSIDHRLRLFAREAYLPTISTQCIDIVMKTFVDRSRDILGSDSPDWLFTFVCSKLIHLKSFVLRCAKFSSFDNLF